MAKNGYIVYIDFDQIEVFNNGQDFVKFAQSVWKDRQDSGYFPYPKSESESISYLSKMYLVEVTDENDSKLYGWAH